MAKISKLTAIQSSIEVDHVLFSMVRIENDARSLNLAKALLKKGDSVAIIGLESENLAQLFINEPRIWLLYTDDLSSKRAYQLWLNYHKTLFLCRNKVKARFWWALDIYVLPFTLWMKNRENGFVFYDSREIYSGLGENAHQPLKNVFLKWIETIFIRETDQVYTSGKMDSEYIRDLYLIPEPKVVLNVPEYKELKPNQKLREHFAIPNEAKIAIYQGLVGPGRGLKQSIEALKNVPNCHLCILGDGIWLASLKQLAYDLSLADRVHFTGWISYENLMEWTCSADVGLVVIESYTKSLEFAFPNKLFEYAMAKIPVIATDLPQVKQVVSYYNSGILISSNVHVTELSNALNQILDEEAKERYVKGAKAVREAFNWEKETVHIHKMIDDLAHA